MLPSGARGTIWGPSKGTPAGKLMPREWAVGTPGGMPGGGMGPLMGPIEDCGPPLKDGNCTANKQVMTGAQKDYQAES